MSESNTPVDTKSTISPLENRIDDQRAPGRSNTAKHEDQIDLALKRLFEHADSEEKQYRTTKINLDAKAKELKALGVTVGEPVSAERLPLNREMIEKAAQVLNKRKLKVKEFQREMGFFDTGELSRVRKALIAAGVTGETAEGSVVLVSLSEDFASDATRTI